jgi:hypothetical protein
MVAANFGNIMMANQGKIAVGAGAGIPFDINNMNAAADN